MSDQELAEIFGCYGVDLSAEAGAPRSLPILSAFAERLRDDLLRDLSRSRASLEMLEATLRDRPNDDVSFDAIDKAFGDSLAASRVSFERFRGHRECAGEC